MGEGALSLSPSGRLKAPQKPKIEAERKKKMKEVSLEEMLKAGVHFGHQAARVYPKMKPFIFTERNGLAVIDLEKTRENLIEAQEFLREVSEKGGQVLFVGTKRQAQELIKETAQGLEMPYVAEHWVGGTFTNFPVIKKMINKFKSLREQREKGELGKYTKKEQLEINEEIERLSSMIGGIATMEKIPEAVFVIDVKNEKTVIKEAVRKKIPIVAMTDVNCNPKGIDYVIPSNDDASKSIRIITEALASAIEEGRQNFKNKEKAKPENKSNKGDK